jgi:hypothetical protein
VGSGNGERDPLEARTRDVSPPPTRHRGYAPPQPVSNDLCAPSRPSRDPSHRCAPTQRRDVSPPPRRRPVAGSSARGGCAGALLQCEWCPGCPPGVALAGNRQHSR